jgi:hypothetical protein
MEYYIRILGVRDPNIHLDTIMADFEKNNIQASINILEDQQPDNWDLIQVANKDDIVIAEIERNPVTEGEFGFEELNEFREQIINDKPTTAVEWLTDFFDMVKVIYAFQLFKNSFDAENYIIISAIRKLIRNMTGGILQADNKGFTNEEGYYILWQFSDSATGSNNMALRNDQGQWTTFSIDLDDKEQKEEFLNGTVPSKSKIFY